MAPRLKVEMADASTSTHPPASAVTAERVEVFGVASDGSLVPVVEPSERGPERLWFAGGEHQAGGGPHYRAKPGPRPGGYEDRPERHGGREDVVAPVPVLPGVASRLLHQGDVLRRSLPRVEIDVNSVVTDARGSAWKATVRCGVLRGRSRAATLRAYPSPSANLTVLELIPVRPRLLYTRAFVRAGVPAIATLGGRLFSASRRSAFCVTQTSLSDVRATQNGGNAGVAPAGVPASQAWRRGFSAGWE